MRYSFCLAAFDYRSRCSFELITRFSRFEPRQTFELQIPDAIRKPFEFDTRAVTAMPQAASGRRPVVWAFRDAGTTGCGMVMRCVQRATQADPKSAR
jgi:hypothetical protein